jgi:hypothetical protein
MITPEIADKRLQSIAEHAAAGSFDQVETQAKVLAEDMGRASRPVYPNYKAGRGGQAPTWDANHRRYAAALPHVKSVLVRAAHSDAPGIAESIEKARAALAPRQEEKEAAK